MKRSQFIGTSIAGLLGTIPLVGWLGRIGNNLYLPPEYATEMAWRTYTDTIIRNGSRYRVSVDYYSDRIFTVKDFPLEFKPIDGKWQLCGKDSPEDKNLWADIDRMHIASEHVFYAGDPEKVDISGLPSDGWRTPNLILYPYCKPL